MKASLVMTVKNEEEKIGLLLRALETQTCFPYEIIFVDGGSRDKTVDLLKKWASKRNNVNIFLKKGATISQGRNFGIEKSKTKIIAHTDGGCEPRPSWFEKIIKPLSKRDVDIVSGFYHMRADTLFQKCLALYLGTSPKKVYSDEFLPSARSIAFRKEAWEKIGGFCERLDLAGEDTLFNFKAKKMGLKFFFEPEAIVDWEVPRNLITAIKKFYFYSKGDAQTKIWWDAKKKLSTHNVKIFSIYLRYLLAAVLLLGAIRSEIFLAVFIMFFVLYFIWAIFKNYSQVRKWQALFWLPFIQVVSDIAIMTGFAVGIFSIIKR